MDPISMAAGAVLSALSGEAVKSAAVSLEARRQFKIEQAKERLARAQRAAEHHARGWPLNPSDRVAFKALSEAAVSDDELVADYLGGVVAASGPADDGGVPIVALIGRLSSLQLRLHYVIYREARRKLLGTPDVNLYSEPECPRLRLPLSGLQVALADTNAGLSIASVMYVLSREGLVHARWRYGPPSGAGEVGLMSDWSLVVQLAPMGAELFLWGHGIQRPNAAMLFESEFELSLLHEVASCPGVRLTPRA